MGETRGMGRGGVIRAPSVSTAPLPEKSAKRESQSEVITSRLESHLDWLGRVLNQIRTIRGNLFGPEPEGPPSGAHPMPSGLFPVTSVQLEDVEGVAAQISAELDYIQTETQR